MTSGLHAAFPVPKHSQISVANRMRKEDITVKEIREDIRPTRGNLCTKLADRTRTSEGCITAVT